MDKAKQLNKEPNLEYEIFIANVKNICNLIGGEECNICRIEHSTSILHLFLNRKVTTFEFRDAKKQKFINQK